MIAIVLEADPRVGRQLPTARLGMILAPSKLNEGVVVDTVLRDSGDVATGAAATPTDRR
ncbi:hypothetical protein [Agrococcus sp. KRD186]|uniref:hypothetical protein n=1 Tax=Agrococcus sp. KRD186 TaxID=2729730 RepID=UPI0019D10C3C|nr:hypothetical protein [Agrococcus sp. KRD186]